MKKITSFKWFWDWVAIALYAALVAIFFYPTILHGKLPVPSDSLVGLYYPYRDYYAGMYPNGIPFKNFLITDPMRQQIPWRKTVIDQLRTGHLPKWDSFNFSGAPLLANIQSGALYPLNILFFIFPFMTAWTLLIMSQPFLSGVFLYLFLRHKKLEVLPAMFGAVCFAFSGFSIAWLTWGTLILTWLWTPLSLLALDHIISLDKKSLLWTILLIFSLVTSFFAGHSQIFVYSIAFIVIYALVNRKFRFSFLRSPVSTTVVIAVLILTSPVWIRMAEWLPQTSRLVDASAWKIQGFFIPIQHLIQFFVPDYFGNPATLNYWGTWNYGEMVGYIGVVGIIFAAIGVSFQTLFWTVMVGVALIFSVASPIAMLPYQLHIPIISALQPTRLIVVIDFCLAVLAAYGVSAFLKGIKKNALFKALGFIGFIYVVLVVTPFFCRWIGVSADNALVIKRNIVLPLILFIVTSMLSIGERLMKRKQAVTCIAGGILLLLLIIDLFRFGWKFTPFTDASYFFPETKILSYLQHQPQPYRIMTTDDRILPPNVNEYYGIESINGYDPIHSARYEEFMAAMERGKPDIKPPFGFDRIIVPKNFASPLFNLLNVRYVLSFDDLKGPNFREIMSEGTTKLYENISVLPRVYLAAKVTYITNKQNIIDTLYSPQFDYRTDAVVESPIMSLNFDLEDGEKVYITHYQPDMITTRVTAVQPRFVVTDTMYDPHWSATIDGSMSPVVRTNYLFFGVLVPTGAHTVIFQYH